MKVEKGILKVCTSHSKLDRYIFVAPRSVTRLDFGYGFSAIIFQFSKEGLKAKSFSYFPTHL